MHSQARGVIATVYQRMKFEAENGVERVTDARWRTSKAVGRSSARGVLNKTSKFSPHQYDIGRRRAGEIERPTLTDFKNKEKPDENINKGLYVNLSEDIKEYALQFQRLTIRGKLGRTVPVLLSPFAMRCLETVIKYRRAAKIKEGNEYVFCAPHSGHPKKKYIRAPVL
ncbi:hypothetical protein EVAR_67002_1 [Eumeta japonica]|uniref:Uncharacterized protein n=1 Tax=Eumeta variegata TaxID=151549 RepID=A0A4C1ZP55_EUMVA|nr:hypothetical protein EVAR_67002_1 [Eumeta japonica]